MLNGKRIVVVLPAFNAEKTLEATVRELPDLVDTCLLVDDSSDTTVEARIAWACCLRPRPELRLWAQSADLLSRGSVAGADVIIMVHPDYQYTPLLVTAMASMVAYGVYDVVLGSRIIGGQALTGGMPLYKYISNRLLTAFENLFLRAKLSEYHTGYRVFSREVLTTSLAGKLRRFCLRQSDARAMRVFWFPHWRGIVPDQIFCRKSSSINFRRSVQYGFGVLLTSLQFALQKTGIMRFRIFSEKGRRLEADKPSYYAQGAAGGARQ